VRTDTTGNTLDLLHKGAGSRVLLEVDEDVRTIRRAQFLLVRTSVESDDAKSDGIGVLDGKVTDYRRGALSVGKERRE
jgi:hypothetical protein